jgi:hypothetical protein
MTDKEAYKELLARTGVVFQEDEWGISSLTIHATEGPEAKNDGYMGFVTALLFDDDGTLTKFGIWE